MKHNYFCYHPWLDSAQDNKKIQTSELGLHLFYRKVKLPIQARIIELINPETSPEVFLFGSPHLDNYIYTNSGYGLCDFDRAIYGPYYVDLVYNLLSLRLRMVAGIHARLPQQLLQEYLKIYLDYAQDPEKGYLPFEYITKQKLSNFERDINTYIQQGKRWLKSPKFKPLPVDDPLLNVLCHEYFYNRGCESDYSKYKIEACGLSKGSIGRVHYLIILYDSNADHKIILDIKPALDYRQHNWPHKKWFKHEFSHEGKRMIAASMQLSPLLNLGESYATYNGCQYWARILPICNKKCKELLTESMQQDFVNASASQIGRGHSIALPHQKRRQLMAHLKSNFTSITDAVEIIANELVSGWEYYNKICSTANAK